MLPNRPLCNGLICILSANLAHPCNSGAVVGLFVDYDYLYQLESSELLAYFVYYGCGSLLYFYKSICGSILIVLGGCTVFLHLHRFHKFLVPRVAFFQKLVSLLLLVLQIWGKYFCKRVFTKFWCIYCYLFSKFRANIFTNASF